MNRSGYECLVIASLLVSCASVTACVRSGTLGSGDSAFRDCVACPEMLVISPGSFVMGSPATEAGRFEEEGPQHAVTIAHSFAVSRTPITRAEYDVFVRITQRGDPSGCASMSVEGRWISTPSLSWKNPGFDQTTEHPVVCVSWEDAQAYAQWLTGRTGRAYRLLSEAEYEYIARAGATTAFAWGASGEDICTHANGFDASARSSYPDWPAAACDDGYVHTAPVRAFPANAFGLFGTVGNVFQWTEDCFVEGGYAGAPTDGSARTSARTVEGCGLRVIRGGSWLNSSRGLRAAMRDLDRQGDRYTNVGFRIAREP
jgi:formylglycine-generating enzyme required for sulfatase activity